MADAIPAIRDILGMPPKPTDHKAEAELAVEHAAESYGTGVDTQYWLASAQVHATLYLAEQQRIANLIALAQLAVVPDVIWDGERLRPDINEGLGL